MSAREIRQSGEIDKPLPDIFRELEHLFFFVFRTAFRAGFYSGLRDFRNIGDRRLK